MSYFTAVRPFFRSRLESIGLVEHEDSVDFENIGSTILDKSFQLDTQNATGEAAVNVAHPFDYGLTLRVFLRGQGRTNSKTFDEADQLVDRVLQVILDPAARLGQTIKDIIPNSVAKTALSGSNDNDLVVEFQFTIRLLGCYHLPVTP